MMKKAAKGTAGYVSYERKKRALITVVMFAIPLIIFFSGLAYFHTRKNLMTLVAILGVLPAARCAVSWIMILLHKPAPDQIVQETERHGKGLVKGYELMVTAYEGRLPLDAVVVCGNQVVCYSRDDKKKFEFMEKHIAKTLSSNDLRPVKVKIFQEQRNYLERVEQLAKAPEKYRDGISYPERTEEEPTPEIAREERILQVIKAISV